MPVGVFPTIHSTNHRFKSERYGTCSVPCVLISARSWCYTVGTLQYVLSIYPTQSGDGTEAFKDEGSYCTCYDREVIDAGPRPCSRYELGCPLSRTTSSSSPVLPQHEPGLFQTWKPLLPSAINAKIEIPGTQRDVMSCTLSFREPADKEMGREEKV